MKLYTTSLLRKNQSLRLLGNEKLKPIKNADDFIIEKNMRGFIKPVKYISTEEIRKRSRNRKILLNH
eukprot:snap_masked-scaffold_7-processed-gene-0.23-mRNA-1 protein AED:1.00 eAED:1.00 QI:0/-1/0/0/-1/1/1/0/66